MKLAPIALTLCLGAISVTNTMATTITQTLKFETVVPPDDFTLKPTTPWPAAGAATPFNYDKVTDTFTAYTNELTIQSASHNVAAKLQAVATLKAGKQTIPVEVKLGGTTLTPTAVKVHDKGPAEGKYPLNIVPTGKGHPAGTYTGDVVLIFDGA